MKENYNAVLSEYVKRLKKEAVLKAFLGALTIGAASLLITALACWLTEFNGWWLLIVTFAASFGAAMPFLYFLAYYPTGKYVAKRLDRLGLDERILTMTEFENQDSYIMQRQRADAAAALGKLNPGLIKFIVSAALIAASAVIVPSATAMTAVYALSEAEVIVSGKDLIGEIGKDKTKFELVYKIPDAQKGYGVLYSASCPEGADEITLSVGREQDGEAIIPVAARGYVFLRWSDGVGDYIRSDTFVQGKIVVTAIFEEVGLDYGDDAFGDSPFGTGSEVKFKSPVSPPDSRAPFQPGDNENPPGGGVGTETYIFDGVTEYSGLLYEEAYENSMNELNQSGTDDESKRIAADYMDAIKKD